MARSTYISENLTQPQMDVMLLLDENELDIFSLKDLKKLVGNSSEDVNEIIENLIHKKIISRIERGKYCRVNFRDEKVIGCSLVPDGAIAYWSALNLHGLTEQFPNTVFIQTTHIKKEKSVFGVTDTLYSESDLQPDIVSRWLSPDPLEKEYPSWSPYNFTLCNPIYFIDPDGRGVFPSKKDLKTQGEKTVADDNFKQDPTTKQTYCNQGTCDILNASGDNSLNGLTANQIGDKLRNKDFATEITPQEALDYANQGVTVIASYRSTSGSGHVAVVAPGEALTPTGSGWKDKNKDYAKGLVNVFNVGPSAYQGVKNLKEAIGGGKAGSTGLYIMKADLITLKANKQQLSSNTTPAPQYQTSTGTIAPAISTNVVLPIIQPIIPQ